MLLQMLGSLYKMKTQCLPLLEKEALVISQQSSSDDGCKPSPNLCGTSTWRLVLRGAEQLDTAPAPGSTYLGESTGGLTKDRRASFTMSCMR